MAAAYHWPTPIYKPRKMSLVIDRNFIIVWADRPALNYFGGDIVGKPCHIVLGDSGEPCARCVVADCFNDGKTHVDQCETLVRGGYRRYLRTTALPAEFKPDGSLQYVKEVIEDITARVAFEKAMATADRRAPQKTGQAYLNAIVSMICTTLKAREIFIGTFDPDYTQVQTIAAAVDGEPGTNFSFPLFNDPCARVIDSTLIVIPENAAEAYPQCHWLTERQINGCAIMQLRDRHDAIIGVMAALFQKDITDAQLVEDLVRLFAGPASLAMVVIVNWTFIAY